MIDRFGNPIQVGWAEHEEIWLKAAMSLDIGERGAAYKDIADMTGRTIQAVHAKVSAIHRERRSTAFREARREALRRAAMVPVSTAQMRPGPGKVMGAR